MLAMYFAWLFLAFFAGALLISTAEGKKLEEQEEEIDYYVDPVASFTRCSIACMHEEIKPLPSPPSTAELPFILSHSKHRLHSSLRSSQQPCFLFSLASRALTAAAQAGDYCEENTIFIHAQYDISSGPLKSSER